jgi:hypothetical protein
MITPMVKKSTRRTEATTLHFNLAHNKESDLTFHVALRDYPMRRHTPQTLRAYAKKDPLLNFVPATHFVESVPLPSDAIALTHVTKSNGNGGDQILSMSIHVPLAGRRKFLKANPQPSYVDGYVHPKLRRYPIESAELLKLSRDPDFPEDVRTYQDAFDTAVALLFHHPNLINLSTKDGGAIPEFILNRCIVDVLEQNPGLVDTIYILENDWSKSVPVVEDGKPIIGADGKIVHTTELHEDVKLDMTTALLEALKRSQQFKELEGQQWNVQYGVTSSDYGAKSSVKAKSLLTDHTGLGRKAAGPTNWTVRNLTAHRGLEIDSNVHYTAPSSANVWRGSGLWSDQDSKGPLTEEVVADLMAGKVYVKISTPTNPQGLIMGQLKQVKTPRAEQNRPIEFTVALDGKVLKPPVDTKAKGTAKFTLNVTRTGMVYDLSASDLGPAATATFYRMKDATSGSDYHSIDIGNESGLGNLRVNCKNHWLRHLGAYVEFLDTDGKAITPAGWSSRMPGFIRGAFEPSATKKYLSMLPPVQAIFGIPIPADNTAIDIPVPNRDVSTVRIYWGGLGRGPYDGAVCGPGIVFTSVVELALPVILLFAGAVAEDTQVVKDILADDQVLFAVLTVCGFLVAGGSAAAIGTAQDPAKAAKDIAVMLGPMLAKPILSALAKYILRKIGEGVAARCIPFVNIGMTVLSGAVTTALVTQTTVAVLQSPFYYQTDISRTIDLHVTLVADRRFKKFPDHHHSLRVSVVYDRGSTNPVWEGELKNKGTISDDITIKFLSLPAGGRLRVYAFFYAENGWQSGQGETGWMDAVGTGTSTTLEVKGLEITNNEVPLTDKSVYSHLQKIVYEGGEHRWKTGPAPTATRRTNSPHTGKEIIRHVGITLAQSPAMFGYSWQATGLNVPKDFPNAPKTNEALYTFQNLSLLQNPEKQYAVPKIGFSAMTALLYDMASKDDGSGRNFFIDTTAGNFDGEKRPEGGCHIRRVSLKFNGAPPDFSTATNKSWGRFQFPMEKYLFHPAGYVLGISYHLHKVFIVKLDGESEDKTAAVATMISGQGLRDGLIDGPEAIAVALDGRLLVLEAGNNRIQAFDLQGNPVPYFANPKKAGEKIPTMSLVTAARDSHYLDLSVEAKGYLYVLGYKGDGIAPSDYRVDIYKPDGSFLVTTTGVAAAKMIVDTLRNLYVMNYEVMLGKDGRPEPSVSMWLPPAPPK